MPLYTHTITHSHTLLITCTWCYDQIKGAQDKDFSYSFSDSLSVHSDPWTCTPSADRLGRTNPIQDHGIALQYKFAAEQQDAWEVLYSDWARQHITIVMLPMLLSTCLAVVTTAPDNSIAEHLVAEESSETPTHNFGFGGAPGSDWDDASWVEGLLDQPHVRGVDFASPERACYNNDAGGQILKSRLSLILRKAREHQKRMVFHIHGGEGTAKNAVPVVVCLTLCHWLSISCCASCCLPHTVPLALFHSATKLCTYYCRLPSVG